MCIRKLKENKVIIDGKALSKKIRDDIKEEVAKIVSENGVTPCLAVVLVGNDPASEIYVRNKIKGCEHTGIKSLSYKLEESTTEEELVSLIEKLNADNTVHGILVQMPLPKHINEKRIISLIDPKKDVDGFSVEQIGMLGLGTPDLITCTPHGVIELIKSTGVDMSGKHAVVIGRSNVVGKPLMNLLLLENCTVTVCHSKTVDLPSITRQADILVAAIGRPKFVTEDMVKEGAIVIDVGINRVDGKVCGDVDFENVEKKASYITPVPGGVGPMTITMLLKNTLKAVRK